MTPLDDRDHEVNLLAIQQAILELATAIETIANGAHWSWEGDDELVANCLRQTRTLMTFVKSEGRQP